MRWKQLTTGSGGGSDYLLQISRSPFGRAFLRQAGLPCPVAVKRSAVPWQRNQPLEGNNVVIAPAVHTSRLEEVVRHAGGNLVSVNNDRVDSLIVDGRGFLHSTEKWKEVFSALAYSIKSVRSNGRILVLGDNPTDNQFTLPERAMIGGIHGFIRSVAKECGPGRSVCANALLIPKGLDGQATHAISYLASSRSAYISGQVLQLEKTSQHGASRDAGLTVVTGGARGIGASTAARLAQEGAHVCIVDHPSQEKQMTETVNLIESQVGCRVHSVLVDVLSTGEVVRGIERALRLSSLDGISCIVHNAGVTKDRTIHRMKPEELNAVLDINMRSIMALDNATLGMMVQGASSLYMSSINGIAGAFGQTNYALTKSALIEYTRERALSAELRSRHINSFAIAPGFIDTAMTQRMPFFPKEIGRRLNNMQQAGLPVDIANAVVFLSHANSSGLSGQCLRVCGGHLVGR